LTAGKGGAQHDLECAAWVAYYQRRWLAVLSAAVAMMRAGLGYFHGDNGTALGAAHQTGWTGVIADVIRRRHGAVREVGDVVRDIRREGVQKS
jgi:hypothetical protein